MINFHYFILTEFDCPGDSTCSNQGACDDSTGTCICDAGFEGNVCQGNLIEDQIECIFSNYTTLT